MDLGLYTFATENYAPGVVALINSARACGFQGIIHVGSPEPLSIGRADCELVIFHILGTSEYWPGNRKAELLLNYPSKRFIFLDADMIINDVDFLTRLRRWIEIGPVFVVESLMVPIDHRRHIWAKHLGRPSAPHRWPNHYF